MSVARRRRKAAQRLTAHQQRHPDLCSRCGQPGQHFSPPGLGSPGGWFCDALAALRATENTEGPVT